MLKLHRIFTALFFLIITGFTSTTYAQVDVVGEFLRAGQEDAEKLTRAYLSPLASGVGSGFSSGWINKAKSHKTLGFDIQLKSGLAIVPDGDKFFNVEELGLSENIRFTESSRDGDPVLSQTISGDNIEGPELILEQFGQEISRFRLPQGAELDKIPTPYVQASLGLFNGVEITGRFIPEVSFVDDFGEFNMWGFGGKANINQWLPLGRRLPFDVAIAGGFNRTNITANLEITPDNPSGFSPETFENQKADLEFDSFVGSAVIGKSFPMVSLFAGAGFQSSDMDATLLGTFPVPTLDGYELLENPISFNEDGDNDVHGLVGIQFKLAIFVLTAEYTIAEIQTLNAGLGISFR